MNDLCCILERCFDIHHFGDCADGKLKLKCTMIFEDHLGLNFFIMNKYKVAMYLLYFLLLSDYCRITMSIIVVITARQLLVLP